MNSRLERIGSKRSWQDRGISRLSVEVSIKTTKELNAYS
jgi:hypothetical protein